MRSSARSKTIYAILALLIVTILAALLLFAHSPEPSEIDNNGPILFKIQTEHKNGGIYVAWNNVDGALEYSVYRRYLEGDEEELLCKTTDNFFIDEDIKTGKEAKYVVVAVENGQQIARSESKREVLYRVCIETGHGIDENGKWDPGCNWNGIDEAKLMIPITRSMVKYLESNGIEVHTDAYTDNASNLFDMLDYLDKHDISAFVNIHCDYENAKSGTLALYNTEEQKKLAEYLNKGVHEEIDISDRGLGYRDDLDTLCSEKVHCPSCLFETGNIKTDFSILSEQYDSYGKGLARGLCNYLGVEFNSKSPGD